MTTENRELIDSLERQLQEATCLLAAGAAGLNAIISLANRLKEEPLVAEKLADTILVVAETTQRHLLGVGQ